MWSLVSYRAGVLPRTLRGLHLMSLLGWLSLHPLSGTAHRGCRLSISATPDSQAAGVPLYPSAHRCQFGVNRCTSEEPEIATARTQGGGQVDRVVQCISINAIPVHP